MMKKLIKAEGDRKKLDNINFIAYSYSHQKFYEFMRVPEVKALLAILFRMTSVEDFVNNHEALRAHRENYIDHVNKLLSIIFEHQEGD